MPSASDTSSPASGSFVSNLNLLLKFARLYGLTHARTVAQMEKAWTQLSAAIGTANSNGLILGTTGTELLIDGTIIESTPPERSLAQLLANANIASIAFTLHLNRDSFARFVRAFSQTAPRASQLVKRLKSAVGSGPDAGIRINEVRFVAAHSQFAGNNSAESAVAARASADQASEPRDSLRDPGKLIQLIDDSRSFARKDSGYHFGEELIGTAHLSWSDSPAHLLSEEQMQTLMHLVANLGATLHKSIGAEEASEWKERFASLPDTARATLCEALTEINTKQPSAQLDDAATLHLAQDLAVHYALARFQHNEIRASTVRPLLGNLAAEVETLRNALHLRKDRTPKTWLPAESQADILTQRFWSKISESEKQGVLLSSQAWCVPPQNIEQYIAELLARHNTATAEKILTQYAACIGHNEPEARKQSAMGLGQMAELYMRAAGPRLSEAVCIIGERLAVERDAEVHSLLSAAFVRFSHSAAEHYSFSALRQAWDTLSNLDKSHPACAQSLRPRIGVKNRIPEFIEKGLRNGGPRPELIDVLRCVPHVAAEQLSIRLMQVTRGGEREKVVEMARALGAPAREYLHQTLKNSSLAKGVRVVGLLSRIDPASAEELLPAKIQAGERSAHDEVLRQLSIAGAPERGRMLMCMAEHMDQMILPMALDEIGMSGDASVAPELLRLATGELLPNGSDFLRVKAIEALGRLRAPETAMPLIRFIEARRAWRWMYPNEMRLAAAQALTKLEPEHADTLLADSGLDRQMLSLAPLDARSDRDFVRFRRYPRVKMMQPVPAVIQSKRGTYEPFVRVLSLEGGLLSGNFQLTVGTPAGLQISSGRRPIHLEVLIRFARPNQAGVEMIGMDLEDRSRLRGLLVSMPAATSRLLPLPA